MTYDLVIVGCGPSSYSFLKGLEKNNKFKNANIAVVYPSKTKSGVRPISLNDVSPKLLQKENLLSLSYYLDSFKNIISNNFTNIGIHGVGGMARIYGGSIGSFSKYALQRNKLEYDDFILYYDEMKSFLPYTGSEDDALALYCTLPRAKSITVSDKIKNLFGKYLKDDLIIDNPRLLVKQSCNDCNQCLIGCHNDSVWYPTIDDFESIKNISLTILKDSFVESIDKETVKILDKEDNIIEIKSNKIILAAGTIQNYKLLAQLLNEHTNNTNAKLCTTPAVSFAFFNFTKNNKKDFFGMGNATFRLSKNDDCIFYGNLYDGYSLSLSKGLVFSKNYFIDKIYKLVSRYMVAGAGFMSSDNSDCELSYRDKTVIVSGKHSNEYEEKVNYIFNKIKSFTKEVKNILAHMQKTKIGADIHYAGGIPQDIYDANLIINGKLKNIDNILVVGGSTFSYLPPESPTLSFMANSYRIGKNL